MPYTLSWERRGVVRRYMGDVTAAERRRSFDEICADPRFDSLRYAITDYLGVTSYEITDENTREIAAMHVGPMFSNPRIRIAAVVTDPAIVAAIEHFIALGFTSTPYRIFATEDAARRWVIESPGHAPR